MPAIGTNASTIVPTLASADARTAPPNAATVSNGVPPSPRRISRHTEPSHQKSPITPSRVTYADHLIALGWSVKNFRIFVAESLVFGGDPGRKRAHRRQDREQDPPERAPPFQLGVVHR